MVAFSSFALLAGAALTSALSLLHHLADPEADLQPRQQPGCENGPNSRGCWGNFTIDSNYYKTWPNTGKVVEYWLSLEEGPCAPDGVQRTCKTFNGSMPGPAIIADWGDTLVINIVNNIDNNGTAIHWHGLRMLNSSGQDGVPGVTQCPIAPGERMTYRFKVTQYGSTWYHSHLSLQFSEGLFGPMILNGPATADYDEDLGVLFLQDWAHVPAFESWDSTKGGAPPALDNTLLNGLNTFGNGGRKFEMVVEQNKTYRLRLINVAADGMFNFAIDGHSLTVISNDLVPIKPFQTDSIKIAIGQRYDVVFTAKNPGDWWMRGNWVTSCQRNSGEGNDTAILRYNSSSTALPTSSQNPGVDPNPICHDEDASLLVPHVAVAVEGLDEIVVERLTSGLRTPYFQWLLNGSNFLLGWDHPTLEYIVNGSNTFPPRYNVVPVDDNNGTSKWAVLVIASGAFGNHPIHLHGHDFWILAQTNAAFTGDTSHFNFTNTARRDVATLPQGGHIAMAFELDNAGTWLVHCHIAWHASQGLALQFVETQDSITGGIRDWNTTGAPTCKAWREWEATQAPFFQDDSGI